VILDREKKMLEQKNGAAGRVPVVDLHDIARRAGDLPAFPSTAMAAMQQIDNHDVSTKELQSIIAKDQALTARILKIVNSAMYCFEKEVSTLSHAIAILGLDTVRSIIVAAAVQQVFQKGISPAADLSSKLFWEHSFGAAVAAKAIAARSNYPVPEEAFSCGLLHDMGKMVLLRNQSCRYPEILNEVYCGKTTFMEAELQAFGYTHSHIGSLLAHKWHFPTQLVEGILYHHDYAGAPTHRRLAAITSLADSMMVVMEVGFLKDKSLKLENEASAQYLNLTAPILQKTLTELQTMIPSSSDSARGQGARQAVRREI
jgi:HD-like signal output (HDOD) protein